MAITTYLDEANGAGETVQPAVANLNMGNDDSYELVPATYPVTAGNNAFEKWNKMRFTGTANKVNNLKVWISTGSLDAEAALKTNARESTYGGAETYTTPTTTTSTAADQDMPTTEPSGANLGISGTLAGEWTTFPNSSDYLVQQYQSTAIHPAGDITQLTETYQWDEQ
ncbi:MAG: hypothetical protein ACTSPK_00190 [Candidatus Heimdallarchaeota archaeon]